MDYDILQSTLGDLSHLLIPPSQITLENDVEVGVGGYGQVFLAVLGSSDSQTKVAVKQLRIGQVKEVRRRIAIRLARELKVWAKAKHPNILELLGFYLSDDYLCAQIVSKYMANGNVKEYIDKLRPNLATRLRFVQGITSGITYLHNCDPAICHGDLKPTNVLVNDSLDTVLCDFGLATFILEAGVSSGLTTSKSPKGSIRYMARELLLEGEAKYTLESDVWAWACTAFEVLTDCQPFPDAKREEAIVTAIVLGRPPGSVDLLDNLVPDGQIIHLLTMESLKSTIPDCWISDPAERPTLSEILNHFTIADGAEALDSIATASSHISVLEGRRPKLFPPPITDLPTHGNGKKKRKGSLGLAGRLVKRARGKDSAATETPYHQVPSSDHRQLGDGIGLPILPLNMGVPNDMKNRPRGLSALGPYGMPPMGTMGGGMTPIQTPQSATFPSTGSKWANAIQGGPPPSSYSRNALPPIAIPGSGSYGGGGGGPQSAYSQLSGISPHDDGSYGPASAASGYGNHQSQSSSTIPGLRDHDSEFMYNSYYGGPNEGPTSASSTSGPDWASSYALPPASSLTGGGSPSHGLSSGSLSSILNPSAGSSSSVYPKRPSLTTVTSFPSSYYSLAPHNANSLSPDSRPTTGYSVAPYDLDSLTTGPDSARPLAPGSLHRPSSTKSLVGPSSAASQLSLRHGRPRRRAVAVDQPYSQPWADLASFDRPSDATDFFPLSSTLNSHHGSASPSHLTASSSSYRPISPLGGLKGPGFGQELKPSDIDFGDPLRDAAM